MDWYYALNNQQQGPVSSEQLQALLQNGTLSPASLVWREGMPAWQPYASVAGELERATDSGIASPPSVPAAGDFATCAYSGEVLPRSEMLQYGDKWVAVRHKDAFIQALQAGKQFSAGGGLTAMVYGGFWWRVLASVIDGLVKMVASIVFSIPQYIVTFSAGVSNVSNPGSLEDIMWPGGLAQQITMIFAWGAGLIFSIAYETWMVGRFRGTVGKLALNLQVVNPDGSGLSYLKAFGRWWGETLTKTIWYAIIALGVFVVVSVMGVDLISVFTADGTPEEMASTLGRFFGVVMLVLLVLVPLGGFGYWMAGFSREKKTLHDIICNTRVVRKLDT